MIYFMMGIAAFVMFGIYDLNSVIWKKRIPSGLFFAGAALLTAASIAAVCEAVSEGEYLFVLSETARAVSVAAAAFFAGVLIYTLFFAIPFKESYVSDSREMNGSRSVCSEGFYALCRHPGVIWFVCIYVCLSLAFAAETLIKFSAVVCIMNILYVIFQDKWTFMKTFADYPAYRSSTPFIIPTASSIRKCIRTMKG